MAIERAESGVKNWQPPAGTEEDTFAEINLDEKDPTRSVTLTPPQEAETQALRDPDDESPMEKKFLDRNKAVLKRMKRNERRLTGEFNQRIADLQAENQRSLAKVNSELEQLRTQRTESVAPDERAHQAKMDQLQKDYVAALEAGDSVKSGQLMMEINRTHTAFEASKLALIMQRQQAPQPRQTKVIDHTEGRAITAAGKRWVTANEEWFDDVDFRPETLETKAIDQDLIAEGSDPNTPEHYAELQTRLREKFPKLDVVDPFSNKRREKRARQAEPDEEDDVVDDRQVSEDDDGEVDVPRRHQARRPVVPNFQDRGRNFGRNQNSSRRTITTSEAAEMRKFKLDPTKDADVRAWDKSRRETEQGYARGGR